MESRHCVTGRLARRRSSLGLLLTTLVAAVLLALPASAFAEEPADDVWDGSNNETPALAFSVGDWSASLEGFVRTGLTWVGVSGDDRPNYIGANNGFTMADARVAVVARYLDTVEVKVQLNGSGDKRTSINDPTGTQTVALMDAYGAYWFGDFFGVLIGQVKPPMDVEAMLSTGELTFIRRSLVHEGIQAGEGIERPGNEGLGAHRELGLNLLSKVIDFGSVGVAYHAAITNGNTASHTRNDNNSMAYHGRFEFHLRNALIGQYEPGSFVVLGGAASHNKRTYGELPTQLGVDDFTWSADLQIKAFGFDALAELIWRNRSFPDTAQTTQETVGILAQASYELPVPNYRFMLGVRYASLDPYLEGDDLLAEDDLVEHYTVAAGYRLENVPVDIKLNYTVAKEASAIDNDIAEALVQFVW